MRETVEWGCSSTSYTFPGEIRILLVSISFMFVMLGISWIIQAVNTTSHYDYNTADLKEEENET